MVINSVQEEGARHTTQGHTEAHRGRSEGRGSRGPVGKRLLVAPMGGNGQTEQCRLVGVNDLAGPGPQGCPEVVQAGRIDPEEKSPVRGGGLEAQLLVRWSAQGEQAHGESLAFVGSSPSGRDDPAGSARPRCQGIRMQGTGQQS